MDSPKVDIPKIKVFVEIGEKNNITKIFSSIFSEPSESSILIGEGYGDRYAHAHLYLEKPILNQNGIANYRYIDGQIMAKTPEEIQYEIDALPNPVTEPDKLKELEGTMYYIGMMTGVL